MFHCIPDEAGTNEEVSKMIAPLLCSLVDGVFEERKKHCFREVNQLSVRIADYINCLKKRDVCDYNKASEVVAGDGNLAAVDYLEKLKRYCPFLSECLIKMSSGAVAFAKTIYTDRNMLKSLPRGFVMNRLAIMYLFNHYYEEGNFGAKTIGTENGEVRRICHFLIREIVPAKGQESRKKSLKDEKEANMFFHNLLSVNDMELLTDALRSGLIGEQDMPRLMREAGRLKLFEFVPFLIANS